MSPIKVTRVKGNFWDRWDDFFDVPAFMCIPAFALMFGLGVLVGVAIS